MSIRPQWFARRVNLCARHNWRPRCRPEDSAVRACRCVYAAGAQTLRTPHDAHRSRREDVLQLVGPKRRGYASRACEVEGRSGPRTGSGSRPDRWATALALSDRWEPAIGRPMRNEPPPKESLVGDMDWPSRPTESQTAPTANPAFTRSGRAAAVSLSSLSMRPMS